MNNITRFFRKLKRLKSTNLFSETKRIISQFFETEYWYRFRRLQNDWYDKESEKFIPGAEKYSARNWLTSTWNGEDDILNIMLLKIEHMFWNLKNHGWQANFYLDSSILCDEWRDEIPLQDKYWALSKIFYNCFVDDKERFVCENRFELFLGNSYTNEYTQADSEELKNDKTHHSDSGLCHYYLILADDYENGHEKHFKVIHKTDEQIPPNEIPKSKKLYEFDVDKIKRGEESKESPQYRTKDIESDFDFYYALDFSDGKQVYNFCKMIQGLLSIYSIPIENLTENLILYEQSFNVSLDEYVKLSDETKKLVRGNRRTLTELLHLRHIIKKIKAFDDKDEKYLPCKNNMAWDSLSQKEKNSELKKCRELYKTDRNKLYREFADFMAENGDHWWD